MGHYVEMKQEHNPAEHESKDFLARFLDRSARPPFAARPACPSSSLYNDSLLETIA